MVTLTDKPNTIRFKDQNPFTKPEYPISKKDVARLEKILSTIHAKYIVKNTGDADVYRDALGAAVAIWKEAGDRELAEKRVKELQKPILKVIAQPPPGIDLEDVYKVYKMSLQFLAPTDFPAYMEFIEFERDPKDKFFMPRKKLMLPIAKTLQGLADDKLDKVFLSMSPGTAKTTLAIFFMTWLMGKFPDRPSLASSHSDGMSKSIYSGVITILTDPDYLWSRAFPTHQLVRTDAKAMTLDIDRWKRFPTFTARSIKGSLTGATRAEILLYGDDLVSGIEEALSADRMEALWDKVKNNLDSRKKQFCKELHVSTRWTDGDVIGRLLDLPENRDNPRVKIISIPALDAQGESNHNYKYGVGFSTEFFLNKKAMYEKDGDQASWETLYMQNPIERKGLLFPPDELKYYLELPDQLRTADGVIAVCDTAEGGSDDTVLIVAYLYGGEVYIEDCVCSDAPPEITDALCADILLKHSVQIAQFESNAAGGRTADKIEALIRERHGVTQFIKARTTQNKETKIFVNSSYIKANFRFKEVGTYERNGPYANMIRKLFLYVLKGRNKHDDVPDALSQLAVFLQESINLAPSRILKRQSIGF
jgi:predicted phage terminase large subunit-like protein